MKGGVKMKKVVLITVVVVLGWSALAFAGGTGVL